MERVQSVYLFDPDVNAEKMIFLSGPRQIGKTTLVLQKLESLGQEHLYSNWDDPYVRREYTRNPHFLKTKIASEKQKALIAFDEIHKHKQWKDILKGLYDLHHHEAQFIVTGSARLDYFRQSGDSLVGDISHTGCSRWACPKQWGIWSAFATMTVCFPDTRKTNCFPLYTMFLWVEQRKFSNR